jgi:small-conductance mechanosensitive channel
MQRFLDLQVDVYFTNLESLQSLFLQIYFLFFILFCLWKLNYMCDIFLSCPTGSWNFLKYFPIWFLSFFNLLLNTYSYNFKLTNSFRLPYSVKPIKWTYHFRYCTVLVENFQFFLVPKCLLKSIIRVFSCKFLCICIITAIKFLKMNSACGLSQTPFIVSTF